MEKLELLKKALPTYLPYGLKCAVLDENHIHLPTDTPRMVGISEDIPLKTIEVILDDGYGCSELEFIKPVLNPLGRYFKNGLKGFSNSDLKFMRKIIENEHYDYGHLNISYGCVLWLLEHHYDIYNLIPKGLAIDINSIDKQ